MGIIRNQHILLGASTPPPLASEPERIEGQSDMPSVEPVVIQVETAPDPNAALGATSSANGRVTRPWRRSYYDQNGYGYPNFSR